MTDPVDTLAMAQMLGDSYLEGFEITIERLNGTRATGSVNQLLHEAIELIRDSFTEVVKIVDIRDITRA